MTIEAVSIFRIDTGGAVADLRKVKAALKKLEGVREVEFDYIHDNVQVKYDPSKIDVGALKKAAKEACKK
jgi:copper chaperone CopZ